MDNIQLYKLVNNNKINVSTKLLINIEKYQGYQSPENKASQCKINNLVFESEKTDTKIIGLYLWLVSNAMSDSNHIKMIPNLTTELIAGLLDINATSKNKDDIKDWLNQLTRLKVIKINNSIKLHGEQYFNVELLPIDKGTFTYVTNNSIQDITAKSKGTITLTRLGVYAAIKSKMFNGKVLNYGFEIMLKQAHTSRNTYQRNVNWLCDNNILACFVGTKKADNPNHIGRKKRYLADMSDCIELTNIMIDMLLSGQLTWLDQDYNSAKSDKVPDNIRLGRKAKQIEEDDMKLFISELDRIEKEGKEMETNKTSPTMEMHHPTAKRDKNIMKTNTPIPPVIRVELEPVVSFAQAQEQAVEA